MITVPIMTAVAGVLAMFGVGCAMCFVTCLMPAVLQRIRLVCLSGIDVRICVVVHRTSPNRPTSSMAMGCADLRGPVRRSIRLHERRR